MLVIIAQLSRFLEVRLMTYMIAVTELAFVWMDLFTFCYQKVGMIVCEVPGFMSDLACARPFLESPTGDFPFHAHCTLFCYVQAIQNRSNCGITHLE
jgi:hypothetical protein